MRVVSMNEELRRQIKIIFIHFFEFVLDFCLYGSLRYTKMFRILNLNFYGRNYEAY